MLQLPFLPRFTLSTCSSLPRGLGRYRALALEIGAAGLDLDATTWIGRRRPGIRLQQDPSAEVDISTIWISAVDLVSGLRDLERRSRGLEEEERAITLAVRMPSSLESHHDHRTIQLVQSAREILPWVKDIAIVVPAAAPEGGRVHITRLRALRRLVEEWDMTLGLDLSDFTDARWEAEVAVQIAGPRLDLVRLRSRLPGALSHAGDVRVRTLVACGDLGFTGTISLCPPTPFWLGWHDSSVRRDLEHNRDAISRIFADRRILHRSFQTPLR